MVVYFRAKAEQLLLLGTNRENSPKKFPESTSSFMLLSSSPRRPTVPS